MRCGMAPKKGTRPITDLSEGGCYLDTVGEVMVGEIVAFRVLLPDGDWLYLEGEVRIIGTEWVLAFSLSI